MVPTVGALILSAFSFGWYLRGHPRAEGVERAVVVRVTRWLRCRKRRLFRRGMA